MGRTHRRAACAALVTLGLLTAGCSNSKSGDAAATTAPAAVTAPPTTAASSTSAAADTTAPDGGGTTTAAAVADQRDTFEPISGVPGVTDTEISFASIATEANNPLGTNIKNAYNEGIKAYFAYRNDEGGIYGRKLKLGAEIDDELGSNQQRALEVISSDKYFGAFVATLLFTGAADLNDAGVPTYIWNIHATEFANRPNLFGQVGAGCADCTSQLTSYLANKAGAKKVASLGYGTSENSKVCSETQKASFELYGKDLGFEFAYLNDNVAFGMPNGIGPEVTAMKDAGVDFVATCLDLNGMKTLAQELDRQGMQNVVLYHPNTYNQQFVAEAGGVFDGDYVGASFAAFEYDAGIAAEQKFFEYMKKQGSELSELAMTGWLNAALAFDGLVAAGPKFDRASVVAATNKLTAWNADGLVDPIDWTRQHNAPTDADRSNYYKQVCSSVVQVEAGKFVPVGPVDKPFLCWPGDSKAWSDPVPTNFAP